MPLEDERNLGRPRLPLGERRDDDEYVRSVLGPVLAAGGEVPALYQTLAIAPTMLRAWRGIAQPLLRECTSPASVRELSILRVAQLLDSPYQWDHHIPRARAAGVTDAELDALATSPDHPGLTPEARAAVAMAEELTTTGKLSSRALEEVTRHFDADETIELVLTAAFYNCVCQVFGALFDPGPSS